MIGKDTIAPKCFCKIWLGELTHHFLHILQVTKTGGGGGLGRFCESRNAGLEITLVPRPSFT